MTIGKKYRFGKYTWTLLDIQDGKGLFLLSGLLRTRMPFNTKLDNITWKNSDLKYELYKWRYTNFPKSKYDNVIDVTLLFVEEYQKYRHLIPKVPHWWWLRSGDSGFTAPLVHKDGSFYKCGLNVDNEGGGVRPALWVELPTNKLGGTE